MPQCVVRVATREDAAAAVRVLRDSIVHLCLADHQNDPETLRRWLEHKTKEQFCLWLSDPDLFVVVATNPEVCGVGSLHASGELKLCYVKPGQQRQGIGGALLHSLEERARVWKLQRLELMSSLGARAFYERHGYVSTGPATCGFGVSRCHPYAKALS